MNKDFLFLACCFFYFIQNSISAAILSGIDTTVPLKCTFSSSHPNRIMVEKDEVEKIIHAEPEIIQILIEEKVGQAFVVARETIRKPITLSVITASGYVQDIEATFEEKPSELVILFKEDPEVVVEEKECNSDAFYMQSVIDTILSNQIPIGFKTLIFDSKTGWGSIRKLQIFEINRYENDNEVLRVFRISNCSRRTHTIYENELCFQGSSWVFLETNTLQPKQTIIGIVSIKKSRDS